MGKFIMGVLFGVPAGAMLLGAGLAKVWKDGRWVEWAEITDRNLSAKFGQPRQMVANSTKEQEATISDIMAERRYNLRLNHRG